MSGPAVGLWLFERREPADVLADARAWLEGFCEPIRTMSGDDLDFRVRDGSAVGLPGFDPAGVGMFFLCEDDDLPADDEDYSPFPRPPVQGLVLGACCSGRENHLMLGHLALALAGRFDALIDFDGPLGRPVRHDGRKDDGFTARSRALVSALPGFVAEVSYDTGGGGREFRHVGDTEFLAAWLRHPQFHLVK